MAKPYELTELDKQVIRQLKDIWERCGYDLLQANSVGEGHVKDMPRSHVIDVVCDMFVGSDPSWGEVTREAQKYFENLPRFGKVRKAILQDAFPFKHYGL